MNNICVFCGSGSGNKIEYQEGARELGNLMAQRGLQLIYGGGNVGLMGIIADEVLAKNGRVTGVIPEFLMQKEVGHTGLTEIHIVESMHERKQMMATLSDGFIAMPGGLGTLEELAEILTWVQLELIKKPVGLLNINGFYDSLITQLDYMASEGFLNIETRKNLLIADNPTDLLDLVTEFKFTNYSIWTDLKKT